jgi:hypothetical protein
LSQALALAAGFAIGPALRAQVSPTCEFAIGAYVATEVELGAARKSCRDCIREARGSCKAELARIEELRHRLKLSRDYLDRYCVR